MSRNQQHLAAKFASYIRYVFKANLCYCNPQIRSCVKRPQYRTACIKVKTDRRGTCRKSWRENFPHRSTLVLRILIYYLLSQGAECRVIYTVCAFGINPSRCLKTLPSIQRVLYWSIALTRSLLSESECDRPARVHLVMAIVVVAHVTGLSQVKNSSILDR